MTTSRSFPVFAIVFAVVYAVAYVIAVEQNFALFTYHPALEEFGFLVEPPREGPAMYWYGWMATAGIIALVAWFRSKWRNDCGPAGRGLSQWRRCSFSAIFSEFSSCARNPLRPIRPVAGISQRGKETG